MELIFRKTSRELRDHLAESQRGDSGIRGRTRTTEEAFEVSERLRREGEDFTRPFRVAADAPESKLARIELVQRFDHAALKADPEKYEGSI